MWCSTSGCSSRLQTVLLSSVQTAVYISVFMRLKAEQQTYLQQSNCAVIVSGCAEDGAPVQTAVHGQWHWWFSTSVQLHDSALVHMLHDSSVCLSHSYRLADSSLVDTFSGFEQFNGFEHSMQNWSFLFFWYFLVLELQSTARPTKWISCLLETTYFVYSIGILVCIHTRPLSHTLADGQRAERVFGSFAICKWDAYVVMFISVCIHVCVSALTCSSSSWSPPTSSATATEAKGRLAICCRSLISCYEARQKKKEHFSLTSLWGI